MKEGYEQDHISFIAYVEKELFSLLHTACVHLVFFSSIEFVTVTIKQLKN